MEAQGYGVSTIVAQDNQSTMRLAENGKASSGKGIHHINIRYFFITDRITQKEVAIQYYPTKEMVADCSSTGSATRLWVWSPWIQSLGPTGVCWIRKYGVSDVRRNLKSRSRLNVQTIKGKPGLTSVQPLATHRGLMWLEQYHNGAKQQYNQ
jgi:hypothetical protein